EGVEHAIVRAREQHRCTARIVALEGIVARVIAHQERRSDQDRRGMKYIAEFPLPLFAGVRISVFVVRIDASDEVDNVVLFGARRSIYRPVRNARIAGREIMAGGGGPRTGHSSV